MARELRPGDVRPEDFGKDGQLTPEAKRRLGLVEERSRSHEAPKPPAREVDHAAVIREAFAEETLLALEALRREDVAEFVAQYNGWKAKLREAKVSLVQWESARAKVARDYQREHRTPAPLQVPYTSVCPVILECYLEASLLIDPWDRQIGLEPLVSFMAHTSDTDASIARAVFLSESLLSEAFSAMIDHDLIDKRDARLVYPKNTSERRSMHRWLQEFERKTSTGIVTYAADAVVDVIVVCEKKASEYQVTHIADLFVRGMHRHHHDDWCSDIGLEVFGDALKRLLSIPKRAAESQSNAAATRRKR